MNSPHPTLLRSTSPGRPPGGRVRHLSTLPELTGLHIGGECLMGSTSRGPLPLYRYVPVQGAVLTGQVIPFALRWPEHLKLLAYRYPPVPTLNPAALPPHLLEHFGTRPRDPGGLRPWDQLTYHGWPIYVCSLDRPGARPAGIIDSQFEQLHVEVLPLGELGCAGQGP